MAIVAREVDGAKNFKKLDISYESSINNCFFWKIVTLPLIITMSKWKEASSLIITVANKNIKFPEIKKCDFKILALNKKETIYNKPQICVFPGGSISPADSSREWEGLFSSLGLNMTHLSYSLTNSNVLKIPIFETRDECIPRWLSLRITAIRETFEECGILLCRSQVPTSSDLSSCSFNVLNNSTDHFHIDDIDSWRNKVLNDPFEFISMCKLNKCFPDVERLFLWSNWLAPSHMSERFDAVFFLVNIKSISAFKGSPDYKEIASLEWLQPEDLLDKSNRGEIWLKPPQWYEIKALMNVGKIDELTKYISKRSNHCSRWMPVRVVTSDGEVSLLPGDEMYPSEVDLFKWSPILREHVNMTAIRGERMHRMEHSGVTTILLDTISC